MIHCPGPKSFPKWTLHCTLATLNNCQQTTCRWEHKRTYFHPILQCLELPAQEKMKFAENLTDAVISCSPPSLATPGTCLVFRAWQAGSPFSWRGIRCWKGGVTLMSSKLFFEMGSCLKKATATKQPNGNHDTSLNSEPNLPFFFFLYRNILCAMYLGSQKEIIRWLPVPLC